MSASREGLLGDDNGHVCPVVILTAEEVSGYNYSALINSAFIISDSTIVKIINPITVTYIVFRMCEPNHVTIYLFNVLLCLVCIVYFIVSCIRSLLLESPVYSSNRMVVSPMYSGREGGVFTYGRTLSAGFNNRFWKVSKAWLVALVGREVQQTTVPVREFSSIRRINRAGKCRNLTGTGTIVYCNFSSCLV